MATTTQSRPEAAIQRLNTSLNAAEDAAKAIAGDVQRGRRDMAKNVERMIVATRKDAGRLADGIRADIAEFEKKAGAPAAKPRAKAPARARKAPARKAATKS